jgi:phosphoglycolate phosphatase
MPRGGTTLLLFDIDGTLLLSGGAGFRALSQAFEEVFGVGDAFRGIPVAGRTDRLIVDEAAERGGITLDDAARGRFHHRYSELLEDEVLKPGPRKGLMPGVVSLLDAVAAARHMRSALLTGNFARAARIKLEHFGIWQYFACGAFGDDAVERNALVPIAVERARAAGIDVGSFEDVVVVGDTPLDVACAAAVGARSVGVATGSYDVSALEASGADAVLTDLTAHETFFAIVAG